MSRTLGHAGYEAKLLDRIGELELQKMEALRLCQQLSAGPDVNIGAHALAAKVVEILTERGQ